MENKEEKDSELAETEKETKETKKSKKKKKAQPTLRPDSPPLEFLQYILTAIRFYDYIFNIPFDLLFQEKAFLQYKESIIEPLLQNSNDFKKIYEDYNINSLIDKLRDESYKRAFEAGFKESLTKKSKKYTMIIYIASLALVTTIIALSWTGILTGGIEYYILIPAMIAICIIPTLINYMLQKKWINFIETNLQDFIAQNINEINKGIEFVQELINNAHNIMVENKFDGRRFRILCFRNDYKHINILEERKQRGLTFYIAEFITPLFEDIQYQAEKSEGAKETKTSETQPDTNSDNNYEEIDEENDQ
ncbi:MAG: hypothetical protein ACTSRP_16530 [Candidatus Helarchaeota archaeon]